MAVRKRFSAAERELLASGVPLQVQNVTQWHDATLAAGAAIERDARGWESIAATVDRARGTVRAGERWAVSPGHVRARSERDRDIMRERGNADILARLDREARAGFAAARMDPDTAMSRSLDRETTREHIARTAQRRTGR